ncbi:ATP-binding protein [Okeania sp.]|uniref:hybrid sensor histidine kinase/response regulator n=1 Tax=Okeania sp. TaxID=3100323 RepID=UPI002B4AC530|nr:ATP-binding protein [Okeania sp.]MEB3343504.1 ATP-binding protein [Okeania sp.]
MDDIEKDLQRWKKEQELILNQIDNGIALFNNSHHLILFNHKLSEIWGLLPEWLKTKPHSNDIFAEIVAQGYWSTQQRQQLQNCLLKIKTENQILYIEQSNKISLKVDCTITSDRSYLLTFRDISIYQQSQTSLNAEVKRLTFLLGLNERLQYSDSLREIAQFALNYLVEVMNAAFGDVKVINGKGKKRQAGPISNQITSQFIATYGKPAVAEMEKLLQKGIPYGRGLLWEVVESSKPIYVENYAHQPNSIPGFRHPGIGQLGIFPIPATDGTIIGVLTLESRNLRKLQEAPQKDMLFAACRTLGVAIERAQSQERLRQINEELERSSQLKSEFLASMSHELRTPLNSILGFSDLLQRQASEPLSDRQLNQVRLIQKSGQHLLGLINDILDLSKIESGKTELSLELINIHEVCTDCLRMIQPRADKKRLALSLELDYRISEAYLDRRRVRQIIINLLSNAIKFTPEGGKVKLSGSLAYGSQIQGDYRPDCSPINSSTPYLCLEVKDSGIGIPQDRWEMLFRPFQQVDSSLSRKHEGTGLGLALTKRLAELHGGTISLDSQVNKGSTFRVWLPLTEMRQELTVSSVPKNDDQVSSESDTEKRLETEKSVRILIVEDQPYNQLLISQVLELEGYEVELISDGKTMLNMINSPLVISPNLPNLILMDIQLPEVDGLELIKKIKNNSIWQYVPVIAVTAMAMVGDQEKCLNAGALAYLSKPLNIEEMVSTVKSLLSN